MGTIPAMNLGSVFGNRFVRAWNERRDFRQKLRVVRDRVGATKAEELFPLDKAYFDEVRSECSRVAESIPCWKREKFERTRAAHERVQGVLRDVRMGDDLDLVPFDLDAEKKKLSRCLENLIGCAKWL
jgi:hypothetical protein